MISMWYPGISVYLQMKYPLKISFGYQKYFILLISRDIHITYPLQIPRISLYIHDCHGNPSGWRRHRHTPCDGSVSCLGTDCRLLQHGWTPKELQPGPLQPTCPGAAHGLGLGLAAWPAWQGGNPIAPVFRVMSDEYYYQWTDLPLILVA